MDVLLKLFVVAGFLVGLGMMVHNIIKGVAVEGWSKTEVVAAVAIVGAGLLVYGPRMFATVFGQ